MKRILILATLTAVIMLGGLSMASGTPDAQAKRPVPAPVVAASITLNQTDVHLGSVVTFSYAGVTEDCGKNYGPRCLRIEVVCSQSGQTVYVGDADAAQQFLLGGGFSQWVTNGGAANCTATLYYYSSFNPVTRANVASTPFAAGG